MTRTKSTYGQLAAQPIVPPIDATTWENPPADGWSEIDAQLHQWLDDPAAIVDYDAIPPSREVIRRARHLVARFRRELPAPAMVVPNGTGGISFEFHSENVYRDIEVLPDLRVLLTVFRNGQIHARRPLEV